MDSTQSIIDLYKTRIDDLDLQFQRIRKQVYAYSIFRLLLFFAIATIIYFYVRKDYPYPLLFLLITIIILFFFVVRKHTDMKYSQSILNNLIKINQNEISILNQEPSFLPDGTKYHMDNSYTSDLDIFGPRSLYHMIHRCFSEPGRKMMAHWLTHPEYDKTVIKELQQANESLQKNIDLRQILLAHGIARFTETELKFYPDKPLIPMDTWKKIKLVRWLPPVIIAISIAGALVLHNSNIIFYGFLVNLFLTVLFLKSTMGVMQHADHTLKNLKNYKDPLQVLIKPDYHNELLQKKKSKLIHIHQQLSILQKRYNLLENRSNLIVGLLLNGFFGYDFIALTLLQKWYNSNAHEIPGWLEEIAWFEAIFSLSTFGFNHPSYVFPALNQETGIQGQNIRHPFIPDSENVGNDIDFTHPLKVILLTGSNMSGKSTFLRSLGVNQVLSLAGSVVAADAFETGLFDILTSFRKADSIQEHTSLFYDELKKLQYIITYLHDSDRTALILLDEILRGTNSDDKYYGSKQVLLRLKDQTALTMLATHDIALAKLEDNHHPVIQNFSFESQILNGELYFDYKLNQGVAINKNATFLMEKMGIIQTEITDK